MGVGSTNRRRAFSASEKPNGWPFSGPCKAKADDRLRQLDSATGGSGPEAALLSPCFPTRYRPQSSASEDLAIRVVPRRRRIAGRVELPLLGPALPESRSPEQCGRS